MLGLDAAERSGLIVLTPVILKETLRGHV